MPATYWTLDRLGVLERMQCSAFPNKHSVQFFTQVPARRRRPTISPPWNRPRVPRPGRSTGSNSTTCCCENAADKGAAVLEGGPRPRGGVRRRTRTWASTASLEGGERRQIAAKVVVDATGQSALIAKKFKLRRTDPNLQHCAFFTRYKGARRDEGIDEGATLIMHTENEKLLVLVHSAARRRRQRRRRRPARLHGQGSTERPGRGIRRGARAVQAACRSESRAPSSSTRSGY